MTEPDIDRTLRNARPRPKIDGPPRMLAYVTVALMALAVAGGITAGVALCMGWW